MYLCSAAEIVEKKRIALEKLSANTPNLVTANNNKQRIAHQPKVAPNIVTAAPSTSTFPRVENKAFLNAPKGSTTIKQRQETQHLIRNAMHPYRRPASVGDVRSFNNYKSFKPTNDRPSGRLLGLGQPQKPMVSCEVTLLSVTRFEVQPSGYHSKLVEVFRTIPSKSYEPTTRYWNFALSDYKALQDRVNNLKPDVKMGIIPQAVLNLCLAPPKQLDNSCLESLEPTLRSKLMPFQRIGVR
uniref:HARP domain-containing protein n=1 Tax=Stomoxys calcitrans TaxID=35570 RepID=A0A1I8NRJ2_STOCA